jgi:hypothetical protein
MAAPTAKLPADAMAACSGRALRFQKCPIHRARARQRIMRHQLRGDLIRESMIQATPNIDGREFAMFGFRTVLQFITFPRQIRLLRISL